MHNLEKFAEQNPFIWAFLMALSMAFVILLIYVVDVSVDFNSGGFEGANIYMKAGFLAIMSYIFIKIFTFLKRFKFLILVLFALFFVVDFYIVCLLIKRFEAMSEVRIYQALAGLSFVYIFVLNLIDFKNFKA